MATKCIDQMPPPSATAAIETTTLRRPAGSFEAPRVSDRPVNPAIIATASEARTSR